MPKLPSWRSLFVFHHDRAAADSERQHPRDRALTAAVLSLAQVARGQLRELRLIRRALERVTSNRTARLNLTGRLVAKEGTAMPAGPFNPTETQDVEFSINPVNAAGNPTSGPFEWRSSDGLAGTLVVAPDQKAARLVTNPGTFDIVVTVTDPHTGITETAAVSRTVTPPDNNTVALNLSGQVVDK